MESKLSRLLPLLALAALVPGTSRAEETMTPESAAPAPAKPASPEGDKPGAPGQDRGRRPDPDREQREALEHMRRLVSMSDPQIERMRTVLERLEKLPAERRAELRRRIEAARDAAPEARDQLLKELREKYGLFDDQPRGGAGKPGNKGKDDGKNAERTGIRNLLDKHFGSLPPEQAKAEREKFIAMTREEKVAYLKALREKYGLPAEPERDPKKPGGKPPRAPEAPAPQPPKGDAFGG